MKSNELLTLFTEFTRVRKALERERTNLTNRLSQIDTLLNQTSSSNGHIRSSTAPPRRRPGKNTLTLREAISQVVKSKPLTKAEIAEAVGKIGYRFTTGDPVNSISALVYSAAGKKAFRNDNGRFSVK